MKNWIPTNNDLSYYPLLHKAITETKGTIIECGMGHGSTPNLYSECSDRVISYETNQEWKDKFKANSFLITDWIKVMEDNMNASVIFIDQAPGEIRKDCIKYLFNKGYKGIIVAHDTEPTGAGDYQMRQYFGLFKYKVEVQTTGAWATALSNEVDLTSWVGLKYGDYVISN
jgi:hypothetical protein